MKNRAVAPIVTRVLVVACALSGLAGCDRAGQDHALVEEIGARVTTLEDQLAIQKLVMGDYPRYLDERRMREYSQLWTEDGIFVIPSLATLHGPDVIFRFLSRPGVFDEPDEAGAALDETPRERSAYDVPHMTGSLSYIVEGDTAKGSAYWLETTLENGTPVVAGSGHYEDELRKVDGEWLFAKRTVIRDVPAMTPEQMSHAPDVFE